MNEIYIKMLLRAFLFVFFISSLSASSLLEHDSWLHISLYHAIDKDEPNKFTLRGNVTVSSLNSGAFTMIQETLSNDERLKMKKLAESDGFYRLKAVVSSQDGEELNFLTYSKACALAASQLADILWISLNHDGQVLAVTQTIAGSGNCPDGTKFQQTEALEEFNTNVNIKYTELAPVPDTVSFIQKMEREREARERGDVQDNRGFLAKYWMYLIPVVVLLLLSGSSNPEGGGGGAR